MIGKTCDIVFEVVVVDDASTDGSAGMVREEFPSVHLLSRDVNGGFVRANNDGVRITTGRNILLLNSDTLFENNAAKILSDYLDEHSGVGICGGWLRNRDGSNQISFGDPPSMAQAAADALFLNDLFPSSGLPRRGGSPRPGMTGPRAVGYVSGADLMIRRSLVERIGLFDEGYEAYCEEVDLCTRVRAAGGLDVDLSPMRISSTSPACPTTSRENAACGCSTGATGDT